MTYRILFEMKREAFAADVDLEHILVTPALKAVSERVHYAMNIGAMALVTVRDCRRVEILAQYSLTG